MCSIECLNETSSRRKITEEKVVDGGEGCRRRRSLGTEESMCLVMRSSMSLGVVSHKSDHVCWVSMEGCPGCESNFASPCLKGA